MILILFILSIIFAPPVLRMLYIEVYEALYSLVYKIKQIWYFTIVYIGLLPNLRGNSFFHVVILIFLFSFIHFHLFIFIYLFLFIYCYWFTFHPFKWTLSVMSSERPSLQKWQCLINNGTINAFLDQVLIRF